MNVLEAYKRDLDVVENGVKVTLPKGTVVHIKEYGTPAFWRAYALKLKDIQSNGVVPDDVDFLARNHAIAVACVVSVGEGDDVIDKTEEIETALNNPEYWMFRQDLLLALQDENNFTAKKVEADLKNSSASTSKRTKTGGGATRSRESSTLQSSGT